MFNNTNQMELDDVNLLAQHARDACKLKEEDARFLKELRVQFRKPILPQHQIELRAGSRPPKHEEIKKFEQLAFIKRGYYKPSEDKIITNNWKAFCMLHNWNPLRVEPFLLLREGHKAHIRSKRERRKFVQFLANGLPNRTLYSVYHRFRNIYSEHVQRRFLPEEDTMIIDHLEHNVHLDQKRKYSDLAIVLKRTRASIWRRYKLLKKKRKPEL